MAKRLFAVLAIVCAGAPIVFSAPPVSASSAAPQSSADYVQTGMASYYSQRFEGRRTASGDTFRHAALTAAHPSYPFGTIVRVTSLAKGDFVDVRITDRLPSRHAIIDLTHSAAARLNMIRAGKARVSVQVLEWGRGAERTLRRVAHGTPVLSGLVDAETTAD